MIEQIYNDFTTKLLPKVAEGFTITKEYFLDLFGRYTHFLFIQDVLYAVGSFIGLLVCLLIVKKSYERGEEVGFNVEIFPNFGVIFGGIAVILFFLGIIFSTMNAIKDKYIPEVRIYEELKGFNK